jgi:hypothetical protein
MEQFRLALDVRARLGEGLHWDAVRSVRWLLQWKPDSPSWREWHLPRRVGWVIPRADTVTLDDIEALKWIARPFDALAGQPLAGALFEIDSSDALGMPCRPYKPTAV